MTPTDTHDVGRWAYMGPWHKARAAFRERFGRDPVGMRRGKLIWLVW